MNEQFTLLKKLLDLTISEEKTPTDLIDEEKKLIAENIARLRYEYDIISIGTGDKQIALFFQTCLVAQMVDQKVQILNMLKHKYHHEELLAMLYTYEKSPLFKQHVALSTQHINRIIDDGEHEKKLHQLCDEELNNFKKNSPITKEELIAYAEKNITTNEWQCFLPKSKSISSSWNNDQEKWGKLCAAAMDLSLTKKFDNAWELYEWLGYARYQISVILKQDEKRDTTFGRMRIDSFRGLTGELSTDISNRKNHRYCDQYDDCDRLLEKLEQDENSNFIQHQIVTVDWPTNRKIKVTTIMDLATNTSLSKFYRTQNSGSKIIKICHPPTTRSYTIFKYHIEPLYRQLLATQDQQEITYILKKMRYYFAHIAALEAGSATVSEIFICRMMKQNGLSLQPHEETLNWDIAAMLHPNAESYAKENLGTCNNTIQLGK